MIPPPQAKKEKLIDMDENLGSFGRLPQLDSMEEIRSENPLPKNAMEVDQSFEQNF
jgi:hypothetical protein